MRPKRAPRALVLDFNGTLSHDEPLLERLFRETFARAGVEIDRAFYYRELAGLSDPEIVERGLALRGRPVDRALAERLLRQKIAAYKVAVAAEPTVTQAARKFVRAAAGRVPLAIGSGACREEIDAVLAQHALADAFVAIVTIDDVARGKPDPETFVRCLAGLRAAGHDVAANDCLVFDDSRHGIAAALAAGMRAVGVAGTDDAAGLAAAEAVVAALGPDLIEPLFGGEE